jgi:hypothetical protein
MPALSPVKKKSVGLGGQQNGYKSKQVCKSGKTMFMGMLRKDETYCYSEIFFLLILINVKAGRLN